MTQKRPLQRASIARIDLGGGRWYPLGHRLAAGGEPGSEMPQCTATSHGGLGLEALERGGCSGPVRSKALLKGPWGRSGKPVNGPAIPVRLRSKASKTGRTRGQATKRLQRGRTGLDRSQQTKNRTVPLEGGGDGDWCECYEAQRTSPSAFHTAFWGQALQVRAGQERVGQGRKG